MGKSLVIVESPAKAKTINKYLGKDFVVKSSVGHIRDLPTTGGPKKAAERTSTKGMSVEEKAALKEKKDKEASEERRGLSRSADDIFHKKLAEYNTLVWNLKTLLGEIVSTSLIVAKRLVDLLNDSKEYEHILEEEEKSEQDFEKNLKSWIAAAKRG